MLPNSGQRTYAPQGAKDVDVVGAEDKRQVTLVVSSAADGTLVPLQLVIGGKTERVLPKNASSAKPEVHVTFSGSANHWYVSERF